MCKGIITINSTGIFLDNVVERYSVGLSNALVNYFV